MRSITLASAAAASLLCASVLSGCGSPPLNTAQPATVFAATVQPDAGDQAVVVGVVQSRGAHEISAETSGRILRLLVNVGDRVQAGQVLAVIDGETQALQSAQAVAEARSAAAAVDGAQREVARLRQLVAAGAAPTQDLETAETRLHQAREQQSAASAQAALVARDGRKTQVRAPASGVITERPVALSGMVASGTVLFRLDAGGGQEIVAALPSPVADSLRLGTTVRFGFDDASGTAVLAALSSQADGVGARPARFRIVSPGAAAPGSAVQVWLPHRTTDGDGVIAPLSAVLRTPGGDSYVLRLGKNQQLEQTPVIVHGVTAAGARLSGVKSGDRLVAVGGAFVRPGQTVRSIPYTS